MAFRTFADPALSRRSLFRGGAYLAAGAAITAYGAGLPFGRSVFAHNVGEAWPNVSAMADKYLSEGKLANLFFTFGNGQNPHAHNVGGGNLALSGPGASVEVDQDALYRIYSMSKPITGMAIMMLIDDGKLDLDMPLHAILPAYRNMQVLVDPEGPLEDTVPAQTEITIRHLLTHTAGLGYGIVSKGPLRDAYNENGIVGGRVSRFPIPGFPNVTPAPGLEVWADRLATLPLMYQPATKWSYSSSIDLLGRVIEVASGMGFEAFLKARLFGPLGMDSTWMTLPQSEKGRMTDNYGVAYGQVLPLDPAGNSIYLDEPEVPSGGGGLVSSPRDYDKFLRMLLNYGEFDGVHVMSEPAVRVGVSNLIPDTVDLTGSWMEGQGHGAGGRSVNGTFGWGGAAGTLAAVDYDAGIRAALWTQYMPSDAYPIRDEYFAALEADMSSMRGRSQASQHAGHQGGHSN